MKVALDAGHGALKGHPYTGAVANDLVEDEVALDLMKRIGHHLRLKGIATLYTRPDEKQVPLAKRGKAAILEHCDLFISIHNNAGPSTASGVEAYVTADDDRSREIAGRLLKSAVFYGFKNRGVKWDFQSQHIRLRVLRDTFRFMPSVLLELGFLTSRHDSLLLKSPLFKERLAQSIASVITETLTAKNR